MDFNKRPHFMHWCNESQWNNLKNYDLSAYNPKSANYQPTPQDHGLSFDEWDDLSENEQDELNKRYIENAKSKRNKTTKSKAEKNLNKVKLHWYSNIPHDEIISAIEKTRKYADQVIDFINEKESLVAIRDRNEDLRFRVKVNPIRIRAVDDKKLKRFPRYSSVRNEIVFSNSSILALWLHVFSEKM